MTFVFDLDRDSSNGEYRFDPLTGSQVIYAKARANRPRPSPPPIERASGDVCPFCEGREDRTPPERDAFRTTGHPDTPGWSVRVVPNLYPAVDESAFPYAQVDASGFTGSRDAFGVHEVLIETPRHNASIIDEPVEQLVEVFKMYQRRMQVLMELSAIASVVIFKNEGPSAGASQDHPHSQIIAFPFRPPQFMSRVHHVVRYGQEHRRSYFESMIAHARAGGRMVTESNDILALCHHASRYPLELTIMPASGHADFRDATPKELAELAGVAHRSIQSLFQLVGRCAFNWVLHSLPKMETHAPARRWYRWHLEILPRLEVMGGCELGAGAYINPVLPEIAAREYRRQWTCESTNDV